MPDPKVFSERSDGKRVPSQYPDIGNIVMLANICVLVVEDEPLIRMDVVDFLSAEGFEVFEASNADQAIACESAPNFDPLRRSHKALIFLSESENR